MDLKDFVSETLIQIVRGVKEAQGSAKEHGGEVSPLLSRRGDGPDSVIRTQLGKSAQFVQFDVALTVTEGTGTKGGIGIFAGPLTIGSSGQSTNQNSSVSRVQFYVPVALPTVDG